MANKNISKDSKSNKGHKQWSCKTGWKGGLYSIGLHNSINVRTFTYYACVDFGDDLSIRAACQLSSRISKVEVDALYCTSIQYRGRHKTTFRGIQSLKVWTCSAHHTLGINWLLQAMAQVLFRYQSFQPLLKLIPYEIWHHWKMQGWRTNGRVKHIWSAFTQIKTSWAILKVKCHWSIWAGTHNFKHIFWERYVGW